MLRSNRKGQSTLEYTLIIAAVVAALVAMAGYVKRGVQGRVRSSSDQIGDQFAIKDDSTFVFKRNTYGGTKAHDEAARTTTLETRQHPGTKLAGGSSGDILTDTSVAEIIQTKEKDDWYGAASGKKDIAGDVGDPGN